MNWKPIAASLAVLAAGAWAQAASAGVVLSDNFNSDAQTLNWAGDSTFTSNPVADTNGGNPAIASTDLIGVGFFQFFPTSDGNYVDLDGSTGYGNVPTSGQLESATSFGAGTYTVTFDLAGNQRGAVDQTTTVSLGDGLDKSITLSSSDPFKLYSYTFTTTTGGNLFFTESGPSDQQGNILDNVTLNTGVPEPATWAVMLLGFGGMGAAMRNTRRKQARATAA